MMQIPGEREWRNEYGDLDVKSARADFFGLSHERAVLLFEENALRYQEGVAFMPFACFAYYIHAYADYLLSDASRGDSDGASCFFGIVDCRAKDIRMLPPGSQRKIELVLERLSTGQEFYDAEVSLYGSFAERARALRRKEMGPG